MISQWKKQTFGRVMKYQDQKIKNPIFISKEINDMLGTPIIPSDILAYSSKKSMRIAIYLGIIENRREKKSIVLYLINEENDFAQANNGHIILIPIEESIISIKNAILLHPEFHVNNILIQNAIKAVDNFKDEGIL